MSDQPQLQPLAPGEYADLNGDITVTRRAAGLRVFEIAEGDGVVYLTREDIRTVAALAGYTVPEADDE